MTREWTPGTPDPLLSALAETERLVVALDFDGTAAELVTDPMSARAVPEVRQQVARLAEHAETTVAYVSGRSLSDLRIIAEHEDDSPVVLVGSHGAQYWYPGHGEVDAGEDDRGGDSAAERERMWAAAHPIVDRYEGVSLERKAFGMGIHARRANPDDEKAAFAAIDDLVDREFPGWRRRLGHRILEFSSRQEGKDAAIGVLRDRFGATGILFAGDDATDEDALRVLGPDDLGVRVGPGPTVAALRVPNPQQIAALLEALGNERERRRE